MARNCQCGGVLRQHELTDNREAWACASCGRYQPIRRGPDAAPPTPEPPQQSADEHGQFDMFG
jgi:hypothetical protein